MRTPHWQDDDYIERDPIVLACQALHVLQAIDEANPARCALSALIEDCYGRLDGHLNGVAAIKDTSPTWEQVVQPLEKASLDLHHALALYVVVHGDEDDPAMSAVGDLLRRAKSEVDAMARTQIDRVAAGGSSAPAPTQAIPPRSAPKDQVNWEAGRDVAAAMFREIANTIARDGGAGMYIEGENRYRQVGDVKTLPYPDGVQDNVCQRAIEQLIAHPEMVAGFGAVLTGLLFEQEQGFLTPDPHATATTTYEEWIAVPEDEDRVRESATVESKKRNNTRKAVAA